MAETLLGRSVEVSHTYGESSCVELLLDSKLTQVRQRSRALCRSGCQDARWPVESDRDGGSAYRLPLLVVHLYSQVYRVTRDRCQRSESSRVAATVLF